MLRTTSTQSLAKLRHLAFAASVFAMFASLTRPPGAIAQHAAAPRAQDAAGADSSAVRTLLTHQAADWNRGDLDAFAKGYKQSPDILFIGSTVQRGYADMLASYRKHYPDRSAMGNLSFTQLAVQPLDARFATATGHFHLERTPAGGGNSDGYFLLVLEDTAAGWKIVRDDTTALPAQDGKH